MAKQLKNNDPFPNYEFHPLAERDPLLAADSSEFKALVKDIRETELRDPIRLYLHEGVYKILDGRNRFNAMKAAGIELEEGMFDPIEFDTDEDAIAWLDSKNLHRRHLTYLERKDRLEKFLKANPQASNRQAAAAAGVDHKTAGVVRDQMEARGEIPHTDTHTDTTGRQQPATKSNGGGDNPSGTTTTATAATGNKSSNGGRRKPLKTAKECLVLITDDSSQRDLFNQMFDSWGVAKIKPWLKQKGYLVTKIESDEPQPFAQPAMQ